MFISASRTSLTVTDALLGAGPARNHRAAATGTVRPENAHTAACHPSAVVSYRLVDQNRNIDADFVG